MNKKKKQSDPPITMGEFLKTGRDKRVKRTDVKNPFRVKYQDGYDDEFYFEYQKAYSKHEGSVHPSKPRRLPKDLKIEYLDQYEKENPKIEIPDIDEKLERIQNEPIGFEGWRSFPPLDEEQSFLWIRDMTSWEQMIEDCRNMPHISKLISQCLIAKETKFQLIHTDFFEKIILHTKALIELRLIHKPVWNEIAEYFPEPITWHVFNRELLVASTKSVDEMKFVGRIWNLMDSMTIRQKAMYDLLNQGLSYREIGKLCGISHQSVSDHLEAIKKKAKKTSVLLNENVDTKYNWLVSYLHIGIIIDDFLEIGPLS